MTDQPTVSEADDRALSDAPPPDKETPQDFENEGGAGRNGPIAIT